MISKYVANYTISAAEKQLFSRSFRKKSGKRKNFIWNGADRVHEIDFYACVRYNKNNMDNLILIGMPSSGKSTAGVLLAKKIGYGFIDSDLIIQGEQGALLSEIIEREGAEGFIAIEERVNAGLMAMRCVIATGGSVCYSERAMNHLKSLGKVVYLQLSEEEVARRIPSLVKRGVVMRGNVATLDALYRERIPLYERYADVTVRCDGQTIDETVGAIAAATGFSI